MFELSDQWFDLELSYRIPTGGPNKGKRIMQVHCLFRGPHGDAASIPLQALELPEDVRTLPEFLHWFVALNRMEK